MEVSILAIDQSVAEHMNAQDGGKEEERNARFMRDSEVCLFEGGQSLGL